MKMSRDQAKQLIEFLRKKRGGVSEEMRKKYLQTEVGRDLLDANDSLREMVAISMKT